LKHPLLILLMLKIFEALTFDIFNFMKSLKH
jgi:hypothetical protein